MQSPKKYHYSLYNALAGLIIAAVAGILYVIFNWDEVIQKFMNYFNL